MFCRATLKLFWVKIGQLYEKGHDWGSSDGGLEKQDDVKGLLEELKGMKGGMEELIEVVLLLLYLAWL